VALEDIVINPRDPPPDDDANVLGSSTKPAIRITRTIVKNAAYDSAVMINGSLGADMWGGRFDSPVYKFFSRRRSELVRPD